jgi:hypothetical protein
MAHEFFYNYTKYTFTFSRPFGLGMVVVMNFGLMPSVKNKLSQVDVLIC